MRIILLLLLAACQPVNYCYYDIFNGYDCSGQAAE